MKKKIFYIFAHQDDEFGTFVKLEKDIKKNNTFVFYLTTGSNKKNKKMFLRNQESIKTLISLGLSKKKIFFIGRNLNINQNKLYLNMDKVYLNLIKIIKKIGRPNSVITHSWEGGHEDHDACNLIGRKIAFRHNIINNCMQFSLYNSYETFLIYFNVFNPIEKKNGKKYFANFNKRVLFIKLLFNYKTQLKIWLGLYPFIIFHYLFKGFNFMEKLNSHKTVKRPHTDLLLYEKRNFCTFKKFKSKTKHFLND